jgi:hypothetical protein
MRLPLIFAMICMFLSTVILDASAEELKGEARREYEKITSDGSLSMSCAAGLSDFVFWAGDAPSIIEVGGKAQPVQFETHKVGDYINKPYQCKISSPQLTMKTKLTHSISNSQCGAGNKFIVTFAVSQVGSYSKDFLVDGCGGTSGVLIQGKHVLLCRMSDVGTPRVGHCAEAVDEAGPIHLR